MFFSIHCALGAPIPKLFNTGVDEQGNPLPEAHADPHYRIVEIPEGELVDTNAFTLRAGFPVGPWMAEGPLSRWIAPAADQSAGNAPGNYVYRTTFDLTGLDPTKALITGRWVSDNGGVDILINGVALGFTNPGNFNAWNESNDFTIDSGFVAGINTLDFIVNNAGADVNPTGLRVEMRGTVELPDEAPSIVVQPTGGIAFAGEGFTLAVEAEGTSPLTYQWRRDGTNIASATQPTLTLESIAAAQQGQYTVVVSNAFGSVTSTAVTLIVLEPIPGLYNTGVDDTGMPLEDYATDPHYTIVENPDGATQESFVQDSTLFPIVSGPWVPNTEASKWIGPRPETTEAAGGEYVYRLTVNLGDLDPTTAVVFGRWSTDNAGLEILVNGAGTGIANPAQFGDYTAFTLTNVFVSGENTIDFRLRNDAVGYTGLRVDALRGGARRKTVTGQEPPRIVTAPQSATVLEGESVSFSVVADGSRPLSYQWTFNGQNLAGQTNTSLTLTNLASAQSGSYAVVVSNAAGTITSPVATLTVLDRVPGLFNTGVDNQGDPLADGEVDPHYRLTANPQDPASSDAIVEDSTAFPIVSGPWVPNTSSSKWIGPAFDSNGAGGDYTYSTTFDLTGFDPATARLEGDWATDNVGSDIVLNGNSTGMRNDAQFAALTHFVITSGFRGGVNTVEFLINNAGAAENPTGLHVTNLRLGAKRAGAAGPTLSISRAANAVTISWPATAGLTLASTPTLSPANWTRVTEPVTTENGTSTVTVQTTGTTQFFRLQPE